MSRFINNLKAGITSRETEERGDIVQTMLIIGIFVAIVVVVGRILWSSISNQAEKTGGLIEDGGNDILGYN